MWPRRFSIGVWIERICFKVAISGIIALLKRYHVEPVPKEISKLPPLPAGDRLVLATALAADVDVLVTGDQDLLAVHKQVPIEITDPRGFWTRAKRRG